MVNMTPQERLTVVPCNMTCRGIFPNGPACYAHTRDRHGERMTGERCRDRLAVGTPQRYPPSHHSKGHGMQQQQYTTNRWEPENDRFGDMKKIECGGEEREASWCSQRNAVWHVNSLSEPAQERPEVATHRHKNAL
ncbi:hypothetical protein V3C99_017220 [Haemonchus contortus]